MTAAPLSITINLRWWFAPAMAVIVAMARVTIWMGFRPTDAVVAAMGTMQWLAPRALYIHMRPRSRFVRTMVILHAAIFVVAVACAMYLTGRPNTTLFDACLIWLWAAATGYQFSRTYES